MHRVPIAYWALSVSTAKMLAEANTVIAIRVLGMAGGWPVSPIENSKMISEKGPAFIRAYGAAAHAIMKGKRPDQIAAAALVPISRKTRSNAKRLSRRHRQVASPKTNS